MRRGPLALVVHEWLVESFKSLLLEILVDLVLHLVVYSRNDHTYKQTKGQLSIVHNTNTQYDMHERLEYFMTIILA